MSEVKRLEMDHKGLPFVDDNGVYVLYEDYAELKAQRDALAAENAALNEVISAVRGVADNSEGIAGWHLNGAVAGWDEILPEIDDIETPATDAFLNSVRAEGVDMFAAHQRAMIGKPQKNDAATSYAARCAVDYAAQFRAGEPS